MTIAPERPQPVRPQALRSSRYPTEAELRFIASRLTIRAIERYMEAPDFLRQSARDWMIARDLDDFDLRAAAIDLRAALEGMAQAVQNREDRLISEGQLAEPGVH